MATRPSVWCILISIMLFLSLRVGRTYPWAASLFLSPTSLDQKQIFLQKFCVQGPHKGYWQLWGKSKIEERKRYDKGSWGGWGCRIRLSERERRGRLCSVEKSEFSWAGRTSSTCCERRTIISLASDHPEVLLSTFAHFFFYCFFFCCCWWWFWPAVFYTSLYSLSAF